MVGKMRGVLFPSVTLASLVCAALCFAPAIRAQSTPTADTASPSASTAAKDEKPASDGMVKLKIAVLNPKGGPVANASVYIRFPEIAGILHREKLAEMNFKTNQDGSVKVPPIPQGKIQIQVIASGWHTFGQWYDVDKDEQTVTIKLEEPPHWY